MKREGWTEISEVLPDEGVLCIVFFPLIENHLLEITTGPMAMAYYRNDGVGWVYADNPTPLRFKPTHWQKFGNG